MRKATVLKVVNIVLAVLFASQVTTGVLRDEMSFGTFQLLHMTAGFVLAGVGALHILLNWNWFKSAFFTRKASPR